MYWYWFQEEYDTWSQSFIRRHVPPHRSHVTGGRCPSNATISWKDRGDNRSQQRHREGDGPRAGQERCAEKYHVPLVCHFVSRWYAPLPVPKSSGGRVIMGCRDMEKCEAAAKEIRGKTLNPHVYACRLDLASMKSIQEFAEKIKRGEATKHGGNNRNRVSNSLLSMIFIVLQRSREWTCW